MNKKTLLVFVLSLCLFITKAQDKTFSYLGEFASNGEIKKLADSLKKPLLINGTKVYTIGTSCISRMLDGDANDRDDDGDASGDRDKDGNINNRNSGGAVGDRKDNGKANKRKKKGGANDRDKDGDVSDRDEDGDVNDRNADGKIIEGTRCSTTKKGKLLLYTRQKISSSKAQIYYKDRYFNNRYFKIIQL
jgi:hypothetical protein